MATYLELLAEKRALDARIDALRAEAADEALAAARAAIAEFGFTPDDLFGKPRAKREKKARPVRARMRPRKMPTTAISIFSAAPAQIEHLR